MTKKIDYFLLINVGLLVLLGLIVLTSASSYQGVKKFDDSLYYVKHQITYGLLFGLALFLIALFFPYRKYKKIAFFLLLAGLFSLVLVFTPLGFKFSGAARWIHIGSVSFQPVEFFKIALVLYLAFWCSKHQKSGSAFGEHLILFLIILGTSVFLVINQPSTSSAVILLVAALIIYFVSGAKVSYLFLISILALLFLVSVVYITPYRLQRILTFLNPDIDPAGSGYHINQSLIALGSGGITGVGFGKSTTKIAFLPEPATDSVFAVIGEEFGLIGSLTIIILLLLLILRMFMLSQKIKDSFGRLIIVGFASSFGVQAIMNIAAMSGFLPLAGVPLPFISYGGSALMANLVMIGITLNIVKGSE